MSFSSGVGGKGDLSSIFANIPRNTPRTNPESLKSSWFKWTPRWCFGRDGPIKGAFELTRIDLKQMIQEEITSLQNGTLNKEKPFSKILLQRVAEKIRLNLEVIKDFSFTLPAPDLTGRQQSFPPYKEMIFPSPEGKQTLEDVFLEEFPALRELLNEEIKDALGKKVLEEEAEKTPPPPPPIGGKSPYFPTNTPYIHTVEQPENFNPKSNRTDSQHSDTPAPQEPRKSAPKRPLEKQQKDTSFWKGFGLKSIIASFCSGGLYLLGFILVRSLQKLVEWISNRKPTSF